ncbi:MAG: NAD(P)H-hydrate dehydratase [Lachnospiraceae bacterium]|nr:NAD(P)H-hydrate dehydratase [Lachnospiraceae bacterium]
MRYILSSAEMQQCDTNTMNRYGVPLAVLMERAALAAAEEIDARYPEHTVRVLLACGVGNNGGDGLAMARLLKLRGYTVTILFPGKEEKCSVEAARQLGIVRRYGIPVISDISGLSADGYDVIADALFGIGLSRDIGGIYEAVIRTLNDMQGWKLAVDIPSGISADHGGVMGAAFKADQTVTFGFAKTGQMLYPGAGYCGELIVKDIGIDAYSLFDIQPEVRVLELGDLSLLPARQADSNKGTYGKLLIFAGSYNMAGAAAFSARAAYRTGAGLVKVVTDVSNREIIQTLVPEAILAVYDGKTDMSDFAGEQVGWADAIVLGPGLGLSRQAEELVRCVLLKAKVPCLADADGLNILSGHRDWIADAKAELILTPHLGEMSRLSGKPADEIKENILTAARQFAKQYNVITVLKDARTVTALPDGRTFINTTGNHGMATAGSGDVLTGIIGALLGQKVPAGTAAPLGVMLHGMAGDAAAERVGKTSLTASDLTEGIPAVLSPDR